MAVRKLSITLDARVAKAAATVAKHAGLSLSAWLNRAAEHELAILEGLQAVREWEAEHGGLTPDELAVADALLNRRTAMSKRRSDAQAEDDWPHI